MPTIKVQISKEIKYAYNVINLIEEKLLLLQQNIYFNLSILFPIYIKYPKQACRMKFNKPIRVRASNS